MRRYAVWFAALAVATAGVTVAVLDGDEGARDGWLRPCVTEDDPGQCWWDAERRGNGQGVGFVVREDGSLMRLVGADWDW